MKTLLLALILTMIANPANAWADGPIQNAQVMGVPDVQKSVLQTTGNLASGSQCIASPGSTAGLFVGAYVYDNTTPANIAAGTTVIGLPGSCSSGQIKISAAAAGTATGDTLYFGGNPLTQVVDDSKIMVKANNINQTLGSAIQSGLIGGGGGASGIQLSVLNGNAEIGDNTSWSPDVGGHFTNSASSPLDGSHSFVFAPTSTNEKVVHSLLPVPPALQGKPCAATMVYNTAEATNQYIFFAKDGSGNLLSSEVLPPSNGAPSSFATPLMFLCPSTTVQLGVAAASGGVPSNTIKLDDFLSGQNTIIQVSQSGVFGSIQYTSGCHYAIAATGSSYAQLGGTGCSAPDVSGGISSVSNSVMQFTLQNAPSGEYDIDVMGQIIAYAPSSATTAACSYIAQDDTAQQSVGSVVGITLTTPAQANLNSNVPVMRHHLVYSAAGTHVINIKALSQNGTDGCQIQAGDGSFGPKVVVTYYPGPTQMAAFRPETINWVVNASLAGSDVSLSNTTVGSLQEMTQAGLSLSTLPGSAPAQIGCSGTNPPTGSTCAAGTPDVGVSYFQPAPGLVEACVQSAHHIDVPNAADALVAAFFYITETPTNAQTVLQQGTGTSSGGFLADGTGQNRTTGNHPLRMCSILNMTSAGQKMLRLMYTQSVGSGGVNSNLLYADVLGGLNWTIRPITQNIPAPVLVGSVSSPAAGQTSVCWYNQASSSGVGIVLTSNPSPGLFNYDLTGCGFTSQPVCTGNVIDVGGTVGSVLFGPGLGTGLNSTQARVFFGGSLSSVSNMIQCVGLK